MKEEIKEIETITSQKNYMNLSIYDLLFYLKSGSYRLAQLASS
jgi:hypothetical protein